MSTTAPSTSEHLEAPRMSKIELIRGIKRAMRDPDRLGDAGLYKLELTGGFPARPEMLHALRDVAGYHPHVDLQALAELPPGSLGREYADHMRKYKLHPLNVSPELSDIARRHVVGARYLVTHDIFHTVLGFDTSPAGEVGVYAFAAAQGYSHKLTRAYYMSVLVFSLLWLLRLGDVLRARRWGLEMGRRAKLLLGYRFEDNWERPLADLRAEFQITPAPTPNGAPPRT